MRILLIQHSREDVGSYPLGLGYVAAVLIEEGHLVEFLDLALEQGMPVDRMLASVNDFRPQAIGFSCITPQYNECLDLVRKARPYLQGIPLVMGGPHPSAVPEEVLADGAADVAVISEGEKIAPILFRKLEEGGDLNSVPDIAFLDHNGDFVQTFAGEKLIDLDRMPYPPWDLLHPERYRKRIRGSKTATVITSRGCPYRCIYCFRGPTGGPPFRKRSIDNILEEISRLHKDYGIGAFEFRDDIFTLDMDRSREFCDALYAEKIRVFWNCETRVDRIDRDLLKRMKRAGCIRVDFGVESGNEEILKKIQKGFTKEKVREAFRYCHEIKMPVEAFFIIGTPWETPATIQESISFAKELRPTITAFFLAIPYPGSELRKEFVNAGWHLPDNYKNYRHSVVSSGSMSQDVDDANSDTRKFFAEECRRASKEIIRAQLTGFWHYPQLVRAYLRMYSLRDFGILALQTLRAIL